MITFLFIPELCLEDHGRLVSKFKHMQNKSFYQWLEEIRLIVTSSAEFWRHHYLTDEEDNGCKHLIIYNYLLI